MKRLVRYFYYFILLFLISSIGATLVLRFVPVYFTPLMGIRFIEQLKEGKPLKREHQWVPLSGISPHLSTAVIASEDHRFTTHRGFDFVEIKKAIKERKKVGRRRGASTISQQTAKNVFLWPSSSWLRKGLEAYFTCLIEFFWSKERIMEVYLNSIEMGDGVYGAEAAAQLFFKKSAKELSARESARIAAVLPSPIRFKADKPSPYIKKREGQILRLMQLVAPLPKKKVK